MLHAQSVVVAKLENRHKGLGRYLHRAELTHLLLSFLLLFQQLLLTGDVVSIPMNDCVESLNASVSAGIIMYILK